MPSTYAGHLLAEARARYDGDPELAEAARRASALAFDGGAAWMRVGLDKLRGTPRPLLARRWQLWGLFKYGVCALSALLAIGLCLLTGLWWLAPVAIVPAFYLVEAQMVFLFPLLLDGDDAPLANSRRLTRAAGGSVRVMLTVLPLAATMLFGGLVGEGLVRSWCLGCLAVLIWYEELPSPTVSARPAEG